MQALTKQHAQLSNGGRCRTSPCGRNGGRIGETEVWTRLPTRKLNLAARKLKTGDIAVRENRANCGQRCPNTGPSLNSYVVMDFSSEAESQSSQENSVSGNKTKQRVEKHIFLQKLKEILARNVVDTLADAPTQPLQRTRMVAQLTRAGQPRCSFFSALIPAAPVERVSIPVYGAVGSSKWRCRTDSHQAGGRHGWQSSANLSVRIGYRPVLLVNCHKVIGVCYGKGRIGPSSSLMLECPFVQDPRHHCTQRTRYRPLASLCEI